METGFFSEEKCSVFCNQAAELDVVEGSIFDRLVSTGGEFDPLTTLWDQIDDDASVFDGVGSSGETPVRGNKKEDFNKMLNEWQEHLSSLQVLDGDKLRPEISDIFSVHPTVSIDELFPVECPITIKEELILKDNCDNSIENEDLKEEGEINSEAEDEYIDTNICTEEFIKKEIKAEHEDECVDIETVGEKITVLEAGDVKTLLEQFEASEAVNTSCKEADKQQTDMSHQNIRDALPKEVIDRIKASTRKKMISLIPPKPTKNSGCSVTRVQDTAVTLCHNKLLKLVSSGESVQLDHDYCSGAGSESLIPPPRNFYQTDVADYTSPTYSRLPDYYVALAPQKALDPSKSKDWTEKNSKKDSGLESGDVSDASEEVPPPTNTLSMVSVLKRNNLPQISASISTAATVTNTVVSTTTSSTTITDTSTTNSSSTSIDDLSTAVVSSEPVRKRKLNLEEYRSRREERERIRSQECSRTCSPDLSLDSGLSCNTSTSSSVTTEQQQTQEQQQKVMHSVEVQATPEDIENNDSSRSRTRHSKTSQESSRRRREYRTRRVSSSSSSSSPSRRSKQRSSQRIRKNSNSDSRNNGGSQTRTRSIWSRSRSPSSSSRSSCSTCTSRSRSPLHNDSRRSGGGKWNSRPLWRTKHRFNKSFSRRESWRNQRSSAWSSGSGGRSVSRNRDRDGNQNTQIEWSEKEKIRQVEERRVIYVGRIEEGTTKAHLRERFSVFGPIIDISVHFREHGDNYGFVTFAYKVDAYEAVEHGNDDPLLPRYDLSFGGRRAFCKQRYADLDGERNNKAYGSMVPGHRSDASFDSLLREAQAKLNKRSSV